jgi:AbiJ N-terminal domain 4
MSGDYFSDREKGPRPRTKETITVVFWDAVVAIIQSLIGDGSFGVSFPETCPDGSGVVGTDVGKLKSILVAEIPGIGWPLELHCAPDVLVVLDVLEFTHEHIAKPSPSAHHSFFRHDHLTFDQPAGQTGFRARINRLFARNEMAYEIGDDGKIVRLAPTVLRETLQATLFQTGDGTLDSMLESARHKFLDPDPKVRREANEKLWDAWERLKTIEFGGDKKEQVKTLLDLAATEPRFRALLEAEAKALTDVGNNFLIRHSETNRTPIQTAAQVDYLFHRLFSLIWMIMESRAHRP